MLLPQKQKERKNKPKPKKNKKNEKENQEVDVLKMWWRRLSDFIFSKLLMIENPFIHISFHVRATFRSLFKDRWRRHLNVFRNSFIAIVELWLSKNIYFCGDVILANPLLPGRLCTQQNISEGVIKWKSDIRTETRFYEKCAPCLVWPVTTKFMDIRISMKSSFTHTPSLHLHSLFCVLFRWSLFGMEWPK